MPSGIRQITYNHINRVLLIQKNLSEKQLNVCQLNFLNKSGYFSGIFISQLVTILLYISYRQDRDLAPGKSQKYRASI
jgi:hypothetical protein